jgi:putative hemolysin
MGGKHIVDELIEERCPQLAESAAWPVVKPALHAALNYAAARKMADMIAPLDGRAALDAVSRLLHLNVRACRPERLPKSGRCVIVVNHPTGIADGMAVYDFMKPLRSDAVFFANADALRVCRGFAEVLIPVEWVTDKRSLEKTKATLRAANQAFEAERPVVIFPAGRLAKKIDGIIQDPPWEPSAVSLARRHNAPIIPINVAGPYPVLFHAFGAVSKELRDITLFHELLNKAGQTYTLTIGQPIAPDALSGEAPIVSARLKVFTESKLAGDPDAAFSA